MSVSKKKIIFFPEHKDLAKLFESYGAKIYDFEQRSFPDQEVYVRFHEDVKGEDFAIVCSLDRPDAKFLKLYFLARLLKDKGARSLSLIAPYLAYMRQDKEFNPGEAVTSRYFASLLSTCFDDLVTIDPHLHRYKSLSEIYSIPSRCLQAAPEISKWIAQNVSKPLLIGPDEESSQWVEEIAKAAKAPFLVSKKIRHGDKHVEVTVPNLEEWKQHQPVLIDDIVSSARTMIETVLVLKQNRMQAPICIAVHPLFAGNAYEELMRASPKAVISCNTIVHRSNGIDVSQLLWEGM
jgi:ribose-phosphate pyrophosphokinase